MNVNQIRKHIRLTSSGQAQLLRERRGEECPVCRGRKQEGDCFCIRCYFGLSPLLRNLLYVPAHEGGEWCENYVLAKVVLRQQGFGADKIQQTPQMAHGIHPSQNKTVQTDRTGHTSGAQGEKR